MSIRKNCSEKKYWILWIKCHCKYPTSFQSEDELLKWSDTCSRCSLTLIGRHDIIRETTIRKMSTRVSVQQWNKSTNIFGNAKSLSIKKKTKHVKDLLKSMSKCNSSKISSNEIVPKTFRIYSWSTNWIKSKWIWRLKFKFKQ